MSAFLSLAAATASAADIALSPEVASDEQAVFDPANRDLKEQSYSRSCEAFANYLGQFPQGALLREAQSKRANACLAAGKDSGKMLSELRRSADS